MQKVLSLATASKMFYWTDGTDVLYEEYHKPFDTYFHNTYPDLTDRPYLKVLVNLPSSQPIPIPINPPTSLQVIFANNIAKVSWKTPHLLGGQGKSFKRLTFLEKKDYLKQEIIATASNASSSYMLK